MKVEHFCLSHVHPDVFRSRRHYVKCYECNYRSKLYASVGAAASAGREHVLAMEARA